GGLVGQLGWTIGVFARRHVVIAEPSYLTLSSPLTSTMRSADVCICAGSALPPAILRNTSALGLAGSPCSPAISHPDGKIAGHGPHCSASPAERVTGASRFGAWASPVGVAPAAATHSRKARVRREFKACVILLSCGCMC